LNSNFGLDLTAAAGLRKLKKNRIAVKLVPRGTYGFSRLFTAGCETAIADEHGRNRGHQKKMSMSNGDIKYPKCGGAAVRIFDTCASDTKI